MGGLHSGPSWSTRNCRRTSRTATSCAGARWAGCAGGSGVRTRAAGPSPRPRARPIRARAVGRDHRDSRRRHADLRRLDAAVPARRRAACLCRVARRRDLPDRRRRRRRGRRGRGRMRRCWSSRRRFAAASCCTSRTGCTASSGCATRCRGWRLRASRSACSPRRRAASRRRRARRRRAGCSRRARWSTRISPKPLPLADVARRVGVHPVHLARTFRRVHQITFAGYVRHVRIEFARRELAASDAPLGDIAVAAGFCDQSHFSRLFKRYTGLTPGRIPPRAAGPLSPSHRVHRVQDAAPRRAARCARHGTVLDEVARRSAGGSRRRAAAAIARPVAPDRARHRLDHRHRHLRAHRAPPRRRTPGRRSCSR